MHRKQVTGVPISAIKLIGALNALKNYFEKSFSIKCKKNSDFQMFGNKTWFKYNI